VRIGVVLVSAAPADVGGAPALFPKYGQGCPRKARPALPQYLTKLAQHEVGKGPHTRVVSMMRVAENPKVHAVPLPERCPHANKDMRRARLQRYLELFGLEIEVTCSQTPLIN
jgi:hypothetical protein